MPWVVQNLKLTKMLPCGRCCANGSPPKSPSRSTDGGFGCGAGWGAACTCPGGGATDTGIADELVWLPVRGLSLVACAWKNWTTMTKHDKVKKGISQCKNVIYRSNVTMYFEIPQNFNTNRKQSSYVKCTIIESIYEFVTYKIESVGHCQYQIYFSSFLRK